MEKEEVTYTKAGKGAEKREYIYTAAGTIGSTKGPEGVTAFRYTGAHRLAGVTDHNGETLGYSYDGRGNVTGITYPDGNSVDYVYGGENRLLSIEGMDGQVFNYQYDHDGRLTGIVHPTGASTFYTYNRAGYLTNLREVNPQNQTLKQITYAYDDAGNLSDETRQGVETDWRRETVFYDYDNLNRLVSSVKNSPKSSLTSQYSFDAGGNLTRATVDGKTTDYSYNSLNQLTQKTDETGQTRYSYDKNGNLVGTVGPKGERSYEYNNDNRLTLGKNETGETSAYTYNALGYRVKTEQVRDNINAGHQNVLVDSGS